MHGESNLSPEQHYLRDSGGSLNKKGKGSLERKLDSVYDYAIKPNRNLLYGAAILVVIAAVSYGYFSYPRTAYQRCSAILYQTQRYGCLEGLAVSTANYSTCNGIADPSIRSGCIYSVVVGSNDLGACSLVAPDSPYRDMCLQNISVATKNISGCGTLAGGGDGCDRLVLEAENFSSLGACSAPQNSSLSGDCRSLYYYNRAAATRNYSYCGRINYSDNFSVSQVLADFAGNQSYGSWYYYSFMNISLGDYCRINLARITGSGAQCGNLGQNASALCYSVAGSPPSPALNQSYGNYTNSTGTASTNSSCAGESNVSLALCEYSVDLSQAALSGNALYCKQLNSTTLQDTCVTTLAADLDNASYCSYMSNRTTESGCLQSLAGTGGPQGG